MKVHTLDIDSGERDPVLYPNVADYVVHLKNPIYDVTKISLISARIHNSQLPYTMIMNNHVHNKQYVEQLRYNNTKRKL